LEKKKTKTIIREKASPVGKKNVSKGSEKKALEKSTGFKRSFKRKKRTR